MILKIGILHTAFIGDVVLAGLLIEALSLAGHEIVLFTKSRTFDVYTNDVRIKKIVKIDKGRGIQKIRMIPKIAEQIRHEHCDVLVVPHRSATSSMCAYLSGTPVTIGFKNASLSFLYKITAPFIRTQHECLRYLNLLADTKIIPNDILAHCRKLGRPVLKYSESAQNAFNEKFSHLAVLKKQFFILAPGSVWPTKKYPLASWAEVAFQLLKENPDLHCALTGGPDDVNDTQQLKKLIAEKDPDGLVSLRLHDTTKAFVLHELGIFISKAAFLLNNDSSPTYFASALNIPTLTVFGPTSPKPGFGPTSDKSYSVIFLDQNNKPLDCHPCSMHGHMQCPLKHHRCMKDLSPDRVLDFSKKLL